MDLAADQGGVRLGHAAAADRAAALARAGGRSARLARASWIALLLAVLAFLVIYPIAMLGIGALTDSNPVVDGIAGIKPSVDNFVAVISNPNVREALLNSLIACGGGTALALAIGLAFSWIVVRTNTPCKRFIAAVSILPLFVPPLVAGVAWVMLGSPKTGLINTVLRWCGLDLRVDFYTMSGMVFVFGIYYAPYVYMFTSSALRNMDPSLEEASEVAGASPIATLFTVTFPLILPAIISGALLSFVVMLGIYGIPAVLGAPANISVLTTYIFKLTAWSPPLYNTAAAVAVLLMAVTGALVMAQQRAVSGRSYATVAGKAFRPRSLDLGPWRWATLALAAVYLLVVVVLPTLALIVTAFRKFMFIRDVASLFDLRQYSLMHFQAVFDNPITMLSIWNTLEVGVITALAGGTLAFAIGYTVNRTQVSGRRAIDLLASLPVAIPGLVIGVGYLWAWITIPGGLYGTIWILALAFVARFMPDTVKVLSTSFLQIHRELEEAAWICGRGLIATIRTIVLPLASPGVIAAMTLLFVLGIRELGSSLFLYTSNTTVMAVLLLDYYEGGNTGKTAAFSLAQTALLAGLIGTAHLITHLVARARAGSPPASHDTVTGRNVMIRSSIAVAALAAVALATPALAQQEFGSPELIAAAKKEGKLVYYTANFAEVEQEVINAFNKRFPEIKVEMVRAPGGQLITRVRTEAAANKLAADVVDHSDRALMSGLTDLFQDYAPPNAADYREDVRISPKLWPRVTLVWSIAYNSELVKNPPKSWWDVTKPEYGKRQIGEVIAASGGTTWTRVMFERQVLGEDYWKKQAATDPVLFPSGAPMADAIVRGEVNLGPILYNAIFPKQRDGAPVEMVFPPEGAPVNPYASGIPKTAAHPNAAKLFLNWCMSTEGQTFMIKQQGNLTSLKKAPVYPKGFDPDKVKLWVPDFPQYVKLHKDWVEDWNKTYNYRQ